jgi:hypothetical protein
VVAIIACLPYLDIMDRTYCLDNGKGAGDPNEFTAISTLLITVARDRINTNNTFWFFKVGMKQC